MTVADVTLLVTAKAPVAGSAKTRLVPPLSEDEAAELAAAALLDTLAVVRDTPVRRRVVALRGDVREGELADQVDAALADVEVIEQRGETFAERLANAHADAARFGLPVLQVGMDTPQVTPELLQRCATTLTDPQVDAVLGPAADGGWWALGLCDAAPARGLVDVPMSTTRTGAQTLAMLHEHQQRTRLLPQLVDVDYPADALYVATLVRPGRFRSAVDALAHRLSSVEP
ncbi:DUF2064 domain-containing protein [Aldersonia kunmingensis]|uniref:TIGR04282 family arsenosugar biosynthesis glycosyltransferase n=1 Tax=Aldersonia kunmingensis TaxID=408066 RepID=UPI00082A1808